ncbi:C-C chemokine receptor type 4-like [Carcharodon carcharias]|uniref:C-C chemokine receptor type 4-like n=1 Tax=Carcharodon carcharias TaxID=13397 RepID=UPI001B7E6669|nr:C-C chemokine receptor type 4-like [Carcharodon carcharias]XP_041039370.1 C-C chemokine receptor type 4-like [Carcharodon carcharias]XP_041039371.1 C-C chemokine receptor type 4-like [Carcharodon carcharias]XP_041039372.1 C-C chemokine receptor type 4-like [Carcharodon carcharias]
MMNATEKLHITSSDYGYDYEDLFSPCDKGSAKKIGDSYLPVLYSLVFVFGLPGNVLVLWILLKYAWLKNMTGIYVFNLALCDLLFAITLPFWAYFAANEWIWGDAFCKIINVCYMLGYSGGVMFIILISIDRYLAIVHAVSPVRARTARCGIISSVVMWCVATFTSLPTMIYNKIDNIDGRIVCHTSFPSETLLRWKLLSLFSANVLGFFIPFAVMVFCYTGIIQTLLKSKSYKKHRALKVIFIVVTVFFVFWTPHNIVMFLESLRELHILTGCEFSIRLIIAQQITESITFVHCCLNPIIYAFLGEKFRLHLRRVCHACLPSCIIYELRDRLHFAPRDFTTLYRSQSSGSHDSSTFM